MPITHSSFILHPSSTITHLCAHLFSTLTYNSLHDTEILTSLTLKKKKSQSHVQLFCDPTDCSPLGSSVHGISQARTLDWVAISFSRGFSRPRDQILYC